ncbi:MAG TPA: hypothetical protein VK395_04170 [Gemmataceae bacterium]|nr:hypothetical protein [Gemmataceae bacterium]
MEQFFFGMVIVCIAIGFFLKLIGKHEQACDATKKAGLTLLERWLRK